MSTRDKAHSRRERERQREARRRRLIVSGVVIAVLAVVAIVAVLQGTSSDTKTANKAGLQTPAGLTSQGGYKTGTAVRSLVIYEDMQCPICGEFEKASGAVLQDALAGGTISVEHRIRSFLGVESDRAANALAVAADVAGIGAAEKLRAWMFAHQPAERTGGYTTGDLVAMGAAVGLTQQGYVDGVRGSRFAAFVTDSERRFGLDDAEGTPKLVLDGTVVPGATAFDAAKLAALLRG